MLPEKVFDAGDVTINYAEGPQTGSPLVLLHGVLTTREQKVTLRKCVTKSSDGFSHCDAVSHMG